MIEAALTIMTISGIAVWTVILAGLAYIRPTPNGTLSNAVSEIRWSYAVAFFILPAIVVGYQEGIPIIATLFGMGYVAFIVVLMWLWPI